MITKHRTICVEDFAQFPPVNAKLHTPAEIVNRITGGELHPRDFTEPEPGQFFARGVYHPDDPDPLEMVVLIITDPDTGRIKRVLIDSYASALHNGLAIAASLN